MARLSLCVVIVYTVAAIGTDDTAKRRSEEILRAVAAAATADYEGLAQMKAQKVKTRDQIAETTRTKNCLEDLATALQGEQVELEKSANNASNEAEVTYAAHIRGNRSALQAAIQKAIGEIYEETAARYEELKNHATQMMKSLEDEVDKRTLSVEQENDPVQMADRLLDQIKTKVDITPAKVSQLLEDLLLKAAHENAQKFATRVVPHKYPYMNSWSVDAKQADEDYIKIEELLRAAGQAGMTALSETTPFDQHPWESRDDDILWQHDHGGHLLGCYEGKLPGGIQVLDTGGVPGQEKMMGVDMCMSKCKSEGKPYYSVTDASHCYCGDSMKDMSETEGCECFVHQQCIHNNCALFGNKKVGDDKSCVWAYNTRNSSVFGSEAQKALQASQGDQERFTKGDMQDYLGKKLTRKEKEHIMKIISITQDHVNSSNHYEASGIAEGAYTAASAKANDKYTTVNTAHTDLGNYLEALQELDADELKKIADIKEEFESLAADWLQLAIYHCCDIVQGNQLECDDATTHLAAPIETVFPGALKIPNVLTDCGRRLL